MENVNVIDHPIVAHKLGILRNKETPKSEFRKVMAELSRLITYEAVRDLDLKDIKVTTPLESTKVKSISNPPIIVSIMRAGNGMLEAILDLMPSSSAGHIGIYRDKFINNTVEYYFRLPENIKGKTVLLIDPMIATGDTAIASIERLQQYGVGSIKLITFLISKQASIRLAEIHPEVTIYCAHVEKELDDTGYLRPGMGDAGGRLYFDL